MVEAKAKMTWGESSSSVRSFLTSNGMSAVDADARIAELVAERNRDIRRIGLWRSCIGAAILCGAGILLYLELKHTNTLFPSRRAKGIAVLVLVGLYGMWKLANGLFSLLRPQSEEGSITEISE